MKAGAIWQSGSDTCVFKPAVKCQGEQDVRPGVSRVMRRDKAVRDIEVENIIRHRFPELVTNGYVTVHEHECVPEFTESDLVKDDVNFEEKGGCNKINVVSPGMRADLTNLITPKRSGTLYPRINVQMFPPTNEVKQKFIQGALLGAIGLCPDDGRPWVIHTDCHLKNVLLDSSDNSSLNDWGRCIVIDNPTNLDSIIKGIKDLLIRLHFKESDIDTNDKIATNIKLALPSANKENIEYQQHPREVTAPLAEAIQTSNLEELRKVLRGWVPYVLVYQIFNTKKPSILDRVSQSKLHEYMSASLPLPPLPAPPTAFLNKGITDIMRLNFRPGLPPKKGGMYWPTKYHRGLTRRQNLQRKRSATRRTKMSFKNPKAYVPFKSDKGVKTRRSSYTSKFHAKYPGAKSLSEIAKETGISKGILQQVYDRGMAAWRTGHRPGASQHAWGMARVHSFVLHGKTWRTADADLARKV
jgi:hypothetical protein